MISDTDSVSSIELDDQYSSEESDDYKPPRQVKETHSSVSAAATLVTNANVSSRKAAKICKQLAESGVKISTPSQQAIYKAVIKSAEQKEEVMKKNVKKRKLVSSFRRKKNCS